MPHLSIVSPVYLAEGTVAELCRRLVQSASAITASFEIVLVEDGSPDRSWEEILAEAQKDSRVCGIRLARNFGQHRAITAGLDRAAGDWVVVMDCDLQDPPEAIGTLYAKAQEGFDIVVAQFEQRREGRAHRLASRTFWGALSWLAGIPFDYRIGNFRIMSRKVVASFRTYREQLRLLGGITALMGFRTASVPVTRAERFAGSTSYTLRKLLAVAVDVTMAYSDRPLKMSVGLGFAMAALAVLVGASVMVLGVVGLIQVPGWASVIVSVYLVGGLIIANLGVVGYYVGKTFDETKRRPLYVVERTTRDEVAQAGPGRVVWITGLSGAGKSTVARDLIERLRADGMSVVGLDGDELRAILGAAAEGAKGHGRSARLALAMRYADLCRMLAQQGHLVVIATISLFQEVHDWNRQHLPGYFEVYLRVPVEELRRRDPKGLYQRYDDGQITHVAGLDVPIDEPADADWVVEHDARRSAASIAGELQTRIKKRISA